MFGIGPIEILAIVLFVLMVYGPEQLPAISKKVAYVIRHFRKISFEVKEVVQKELTHIERDLQLKEMKEELSKLQEEPKKILEEVQDSLRFDANPEPVKKSSKSTKDDVTEKHGIVKNIKDKA